MSRRPKPTALKILTGNPGRKPLRSGEPQYPVGGLRCPAHLGEVAKKKWLQLFRLLSRNRVVTVADATALELAADVYEQWHYAREVVRKDGTTYSCTTKSGEVMIRQRPEVRIASQAWDQLVRLLIEFGLTPAARTKVNQLPPAPDSEDELEAMLSGLPVSRYARDRHAVPS